MVKNGLALLMNMANEVQKLNSAEIEASRIGQLIAATKASTQSDKAYLLLFQIALTNPTANKFLNKLK